MEDELKRFFETEEAISEEYLIDLVFGNTPHRIVSEKSFEAFKGLEPVETVVEIDDKFALIRWRRDLSGWGEHEFIYDPFLVHPVEKTVIEYVEG